MNYPIWGIPAPGLLIAAVSILHVFISHFAVGGGLFLVVAERKGRREGDAAWLAFLVSLSRGFVLLTLVLGALSGVGIWFTIGLVQPQATSALVTTFVWAWAIEWTFFAVEIASAMVYYYGWTRLAPETHERVGWVYFVSAWASLVVISGILAFMLTSGAWTGSHSFADGFFNPTFLPMVALRTAVAVLLAGLYALFAGAFVGDAELRGRLARWSVVRWIVPGAVAVPLVLLFYLHAAAGAGVAVAETLGARSAAAASILAAAFSGTTAGQPIVRGAMRLLVVSAVLLVAGSLLVAALRSRRYGRLEAGVLMLLGLASLGGGEWVREGLRKPWVIDRYMLVNSVRLPAARGGTPGADPFSLEELQRRGVLASARWADVPAAWKPGDPAFESLPASERAGLHARAGREVFRLECSICHTERGHLGIVPLVHGQSVTSLETVLDELARPTDAAGRPIAWTDPHLGLSTWLGRRMPPFAGTEAEEHALAIHLARLGGDAQARASEPAASDEGLEVFETHCAPCHGEAAPWPIAARLRGRGMAELYDLIGRLPEVRQEMPPFEGTDAERRALARYLAGLSIPSASPAGSAGEEQKP